MIRSSAGRRCGFVAAIAGLVVGTAGLAAPAFADPSSDPAGPSSAPKDTSAGVLSSHDLDLLADAEAAGKRQVTLLIAADRGETADVAVAVDKLGGTVAEQFNKVGYLRVSVPTGKVLKTAEVPGIAAIDLDEELQMPDPRVAASKQRSAVQARTLPGPGASTPDVNPYMPTNETGATTFRKAHPTWDGRGVTIGILDSGVDLDHPALATTSTGERKIVDWVTATDPILDGDLTWRRMDTSVTGPSFAIAGAHLDGARGRLQVQPLPGEHHGRQRAGRRRQPRR